jgi:hypothetical protein
VRVWSVDFQNLALPEVLNHVAGHPVSRIDSLLIRVPHVMSNELQDELRVDWPWEGASGRGAALSLAVGEIRGEGTQRVGAHSRIGLVLQSGDVGIGQDLGIAVGRGHWDDGRQRVELSCPLELVCRTGQHSLPPHHNAPSSDMLWPVNGRAPLICEL